MRTSCYCHPKTLYLDPFNLLDNLLDIMSESRDCFFAAPALAIHYKIISSRYLLENLVTLA